MNTRSFLKILAMLLTTCCMLVAVSCSTTKRLADDEVLYTGVEDVEMKTPQGDDKLPRSVSKQLVAAVNVKPNASLLSPFYRWPIQPGLWVYNNWNDSTKSGFKHWLYELLVSDPVLISDVKPEVRVKMLSTVMDNNGYFGSKTSYEILYSKKDPKQAKILYTVQSLDPYLYREIDFFKATTPLEHEIDSMARKEPHLRVGARYCTDSLSIVRINITNQLRNNGYYFFRPEYIEFLADTTIESRHVALKLKLADNIPEKALNKYYVGNVTASVKNYFEYGVPDTMTTNNCTVIKYNPIRLRKNLVPSCISMRKGRVFSVRRLERTQENLSRLGIFSSINIDTTPLDSVQSDTLDIFISCKLDMPIETKFEIQGVSKSNSYLGPSAVIGLTNKNLFGGGEQLNSSLNFSYEWQTGKKVQNKLDSYEVGLDFTLAFPRLLAPKFVDRSRRYINWTNVSMSFNLLNQPKYFRMFDFNLGFNWEWHANRYSLNMFSPLSIKYTHLFSMTDEFFDLALDNPVIAASFTDQLMPMMTYSYTYDRQYGDNEKFNWNITVSESGNIACGILSLAGSKNEYGEKTLLGTEVSQFVKLSTQAVYSYQFHHDNWLVTRAYVGVAHAYGNSTSMPFSEQFYVGGSNSLRAFPLRSIGPGSFHDEDEIMGFYDHTGTFKFELNFEYRFPIISYFKGALFIDTGNVWLLEDDEYRPGGLLTLKSFFKDLAIGTGVGLRFDMDIIVVRADLGIGLHCPYDTGKNRYFNLPSFKESLSFHLAIGYPF